MESIDDVVCYFLIEDGLVVQKSYPFVEGWIEGPEYVTPGYLYSNGVFTAPPVPDETYIGANTQKLNTLLAQANAQITAIQGRIDAINDAIEFGEDEPGWAEEVPVRQAQLTTWKRYRVTLNKIPLQEGWAITATWPVTPEPYTSEMSRASSSN